MNRDQIRSIFLRNGFTIKEGQDDLKPYVYAAAEELLQAALDEQRPKTSEIMSVSHDWDDQDKCRRCGARNWWTSATCTPKQQSYDI